MEVRDGEEEEEGNVSLCISVTVVAVEKTSLVWLLALVDEGECLASACNYSNAEASTVEVISMAAVVAQRE